MRARQAWQSKSGVVAVGQTTYIGGRGGRGASLLGD